jgi:competence ComEA-like helix-hairpin-helix protein
MLSFTRQERLVLIFIAATALSGLGLNFCLKESSSLDIRRIIEEQKTTAPLNLNNASLSDLAKVAAIGPALAQAIIDFRHLHGNFKSLDELKLIKGISQSKLNQIKPALTLD